MSLPFDHLSVLAGRASVTKACRKLARRKSNRYQLPSDAFPQKLVPFVVVTNDAYDHTCVGVKSCKVASDLRPASGKRNCVHA